MPSNPKVKVLAREAANIQESNADELQTHSVTPDPQPTVSQQEQ